MGAANRPDVNVPSEDVRLYQLIGRIAELRPLGELVAGWRERAEAFVGEEPQAWVATLAGRNDLPLLSAGDLDVAMLEEAARVLRQIQGVRFAAPDDRTAVAERISALGLDRAEARDRLRSGRAASLGRHVPFPAPRLRGLHDARGARCRGAADRRRSRH